jgi:hypothetical protein
MVQGYGNMLEAQSPVYFYRSLNFYLDVISHKICTQVGMYMSLGQSFAQY